MDHAKKFYLVDSSKHLHNDGYQFSSKERTQTLEQREIRNLDKRMLDVVNNANLSEEQKVSEYNKLLTEFQSARDLSSHGASKPFNQTRSNENQKNLSEPSSNHSLNQYNPMLGITKPYQSKAGKLLELLNSTTRFNVAENGEMIIDKKRIPHSNISDALNKAVNPQNRLGVIPGWNEFASFLNDSNPPQTLVGNRIQSHITSPVSLRTSSSRQSRSRNRRLQSRSKSRQTSLVDHWVGLKNGKGKQKK